MSFCTKDIKGAQRKRPIVKVRTRKKQVVVGACVFLYVDYVCAIVYVCIYVYACVYSVYMWICVDYVHMHVYISLCWCIYMCVRCLHECICVHMYICVCVICVFVMCFMCGYMCVCVYEHRSSELGSREQDPC